MNLEGQVGPQVLADGAVANLRLGKTGEASVSELHGRLYEQNYRSALFSGGMSSTSIANATFTLATLGATCTPIAGVWNPSTSPVNLEILQCVLSAIITALQNTGCGPYVWATSVGNAVITTGNAPLNRKSLVKAGSYAKDMSGVALTGLTNNLVVMGAAALGGGAAHQVAVLDTAAGLSTVHAPSVENIDGSWIVPPGGVLALLAAATPVAVSAASMLSWIEALL